MRDPYTLTRRCCYLGSMIQAVILNVTPLFFVTLSSRFGILFEQIGRLILITFFVQLLVDLTAVYFVNKWGFRLCMAMAEGCAALGLILFGILPNVMSDAYSGMVLAVMVYSVGAGLAEVIISPIIDALPSEKKAASMTFLHAFYPIGQVLAVLVTTLIVALFGSSNWWWILPLWAVVPLINLVLVLRVPMPPMVAVNEKTPVITLVKQPTFWLMMLLMICAGASEIAMAQWASMFAETGLGVPKLIGDLLGPCLFAVFMGIGRLWHGRSGERIAMPPLLIGCSAATVVCYLLAIFASPFFALVGCALCGLAVSLMWPGILGIAAARFQGGTIVFALLAFGGDIGCSLGPWITGIVADHSPYGLKAGLLAAVIFPLIMLSVLLLTKRKKASD